MANLLLSVQAWSPEVNKALYEQSDFTSLSKLYNQFTNNSTFTLPATNAVDAEDDNYQRPLGVTQFSATGKTISMEGLIVKPRYLKLDEQKEFNFDLRQAELTELMAGLGSRVKEKILYSWLTSADLTNNVVITNGVTGSTAPSWASGTRLKLVAPNILSARIKLNKQNVPQDGRVLLVNTDTVPDILAMPEFINSDSLTTKILTDGFIGKIYGFNVIEANFAKSTVTVSGSTITANSFEVTGATDSYYAMAYHPDFVCKVVGTTDIGAEEFNIFYTSPMYTLTQRIGGGTTRHDKKGVVIIAQGR